MDRIKVKYVLDIGMLAAFVTLATTGIIKFPGLFGKGNLPMKQINFIHDWTGIILLVLIFIHLMLNWKWLTCMTKSFLKKDKKKCD